jgi:peptide/nickel transport system ATP-binding protein
MAEQRSTPTHDDAAPTTATGDSLLEVEDLAVRFDTEGGVVRAVDHNSFSIGRGETVGLVGESGSGKSVTARSIMGLVESPGRIDNGEIRFDGENLLEYGETEMREIRGDRISMIFQDPMSSLNPAFTVGQQIKRVLRLHTDVGESGLNRWLRKLPGLDRSLSEADEEAAKLLDRVGIPDPVERLHDYPHQFSGGMRQRVLIAMAIASDPELLIADEPTTALDVTIEAQIFELLSELQAELGMSMLLITHDLSVVADTCDRAIIIYAGSIVERAGIYELFDEPLHPYTRGLLNLIPRPDTRTEQLDPIPGTVPDLTDVPDGCSFHPRCPEAVEECTSHDPELQEVRPGRDAACIEVEGYQR